MAIKGRKETRGGSREGSGRKKLALGASQVQRMLADAEKYEKQFGKSINEILLSFIYSSDLEEKLRLSAIKVWLDKSCVPISEGGEADKELGPGIFLPQQRPDPSGKVVSIAANG